MVSYFAGTPKFDTLFQRSMMAENSAEQPKVSFNFQPITCGQLRHQARLFYKAFQYLVKPSWQLAISEVFLSAIPLISFYFVASLGYDHLIGIGYGISLCNLVGTGFCYASTLACEEITAKEADLKGAVSAIQRGLVFTLTLMCLPCLAIWLNANAVIKGLNQSPALSRLGGEYCLAFLPGLPLFVLILYLQRFIYLIKQNSGFPIICCNFIGAIISIGLNAAFVKGFNMGVRGGAVATVLTYLCIVLLLAFCIIWYPKYRKAWLGWHWDLIVGWENYFLKLLPYLLWIIAEWWTLDVGIYVIGTLSAVNRRLGTQITTAFIIRFLSIIADKFAAEASEQIKEAAYAKYHRRAIFIVKCSILITWISSFFCGFLLISLPELIPTSFTNQRPFGLSAIEMVLVVSPIPFLKGTQALGFHVVRKLKSRYLNVVICLIGFWVFSLPIGLCLVYLRHWQMMGFWAGYTIGLLVQALIFLVILKDCMQEWSLSEQNKPLAPSTPSGTLRNGNDETDGFFHTKSLLLGEPRINMRFNSMDISMEEPDCPKRTTRPSTVRMVLTGLVCIFSLAILIAGIAVTVAGICD